MAAGDELSFGGRGPFEHEIPQIVAAVAADADADAGEALARKADDDAFQAVVAAGRPAGADADGTAGKVDIVAQHEHMGGGDAVVARGGADGAARQVHIGQRLHQQHRLPGQQSGAGQRLELLALDGRTALGGDVVERLVAAVVPCGGILLAWVAEAGDDELGLLSEQHGGVSSFGGGRAAVGDASVFFG